MSFKDATFQLHSWVQNVFPASYLVEISQNRLITHPLYSKLYFKILRYLILLLGVIGLPTTVIHLIWLFVNWETYTYENGSEAVLYIIAASGLFILNYCNYLLVRKGNDRIFVITQVCKLAPDDSSKNGYKLLGKYTTKQLFIYGLSAVFLILDLSMVLLPFAISIDPIQIAIGQSIFAKLQAALIYGLGMSFMGWYLLSTFILYITALEKIEFFTRKLVHKLPKVTSIQPLPSHKFYKCFQDYQISYVFFTIGLESVADFPLVLISVGIILCSITTTGTLTMWGRINIMTYFLLPAVSGIAFSIALVVTYVGALPYVNALRCHRFWKYHVRKRLDKRMLRTLRPFGFLIGPYGICTTKLGLLICDDIINNTVDLLLMF